MQELNSLKYQLSNIKNQRYSNNKTLNELNIKLDNLYNTKTKALGFLEDIEIMSNKSISTPSQTKRWNGNKYIKSNEYADGDLRTIYNTYIRRIEDRLDEIDSEITRTKNKIAEAEDNIRYFDRRINEIYREIKLLSS